MNSFQLHCIVCNINFSTEKEIQKHENLSGVCRELWKVFVKYLKLVPSKWRDIFEFYIHLNQVPFCPECRNVVAQLYVCNNKLNKKKASQRQDSLEEEVTRIVDEISSTITKSCDETFPEIDGEEDEDNKKRVMIQRVMDLRQTISHSHNLKMMDIESTTRRQEDIRPIKIERDENNSIDKSQHFNDDDDYGDIPNNTTIKTENNNGSYVLQIEEEPEQEFSPIIKAVKSIVKTEKKDDDAEMIRHLQLENENDDYEIDSGNPEEKLQCANCYENFVTWSDFYSHCKTCQKISLLDNQEEEDEDDDGVSLSQDPLELPQNNNNTTTTNTHKHHFVLTTEFGVECLICGALPQVATTKVGSKKTSYTLQQIMAGKMKQDLTRSVVASKRKQDLSTTRFIMDDLTKVQGSKPTPIILSKPKPTTKYSPGPVNAHKIQIFIPPPPPPRLLPPLPKIMRPVEKPVEKPGRKISAERKRRQHLSQQFLDLKRVMPRCKGEHSQKCSKVCILTRAKAYINEIHVTERQLIIEKEKMKLKSNSLIAYVDVMNLQINSDNS